MPILSFIASEEFCGCDPVSPFRGSCSGTLFLKPSGVHPVGSFFRASEGTS